MYIYCSLMVVKSSATVAAATAAAACLPALPACLPAACTRRKNLIRSGSSANRSVVSLSWAVAATVCIQIFKRENVLSLIFWIFQTLK